MRATLEDLVRRITGIADRVEKKPDIMWATVIGESPLSVKFDGSDVPVYGSPDRAVGDLRIGDRVVCALVNRRVIVIAKGNAAAVPVGTIHAFAGVAAPDGFLLCDGSMVLRAAYPALFSVIGAVFGAGDGSTTFALPDMRGRVAAGYDSTQTEFNALGKKYGTKTHTLTIAEMPSHNHTPHVWGITLSYNANTGQWGAGSGVSFDTFTQDDDQTRRTGTAGGGGAHNNIQPSLAVNFIIKT